MKQILAIFMKDARRFLPEVLVSFATLTAFIVVYPNHWRAYESLHGQLAGSLVFSGGTLSFLASCLVILIPVTWWILIVRAIQGESLVGTTQLWLTRPYQWPKLLASKVLYLFVFLCFPFLVAQCALLVEGGFRPFAYLTGLLVNLFLITSVIVLPLVAFSTLTSSFGKMALALLGVVLYMALVQIIGSLAPADTTGDIPSPIGGDIILLLLIGGCCAVILVQYSSRRSRTAWILMTAVVVALSVVPFLDPKQWSIDHYYPAPRSGGAAAVTLAYAPGVGTLPLALTVETKDKGELEISIPVTASQVFAGYAAVPVALKAKIYSPDGAHWESPWQAVYNERYLPEGSGSTLRFRIRRAIFEKFSSMPVTLHIAVAIDQAKIISTTTIPLPSAEFSVPGFGICVPQTASRDNPSELTGISCRSAMRSPQLTYVSTHWIDADCLSAEAKTNLAPANAWAGTLNRTPADFGITSVWETPLSLSNPWADYYEGQTPRLRHLCAGAPVAFTSYAVANHSRVELTLENFWLPHITSDSFGADAQQ